MRSSSFLLALPVLLTACAALPSPGQILPAVPIPTHAAEGIVTVDVEGRLERRGPCLFIARTRPDDGRTFRRLVIWPEGTRFDGRFVAPAFPFGKQDTLRVGQTVVLEGNGPQWEPHILRHYPHLRSWQQACKADPFFAETVRRPRK